MRRILCVFEPFRRSEGPILGASSLIVSVLSVIQRPDQPVPLFSLPIFMIICLAFVALSCGGYLAVTVFAEPITPPTVPPESSPLVDARDGLQLQDAPLNASVASITAQIIVPVICTPSSFIHSARSLH